MTTRRRPKRRSSFRASVFLFWALLGVMTFAVALNLLMSAPQALGRLDLSWGVNDSQEGAYALQGHRVASGGALFEAPRALDSPEGGPVYPLVLAAFASRGSTSAVVPYRHVSAALWLLSLLPLCAIALLFAREAVIATQSVCAARHRTGDDHSCLRSPCSERSPSTSRTSDRNRSSRRSC